MKVKELIEFLQRYNPELELTLSITENKEMVDIVSPFWIQIEGMERISCDYKKKKRRKNG